MTDHPKIENAPGLTWKPRKVGWEARWAARTDLVRRGWEPKSIRVWCGAELGPIDIAFIQDRCNIFQNEMLIWGRGGIPTVSGFDGTLRSLIASYQTDKDSPYRKLRFNTRGNYDSLTKRIEHDRGNEFVSEIKGRTLLRWHEDWSAGGKVAMAHSLMGMVRTLMTFGATILDDENCVKVKTLLHSMKFKMAKQRDQRLTAEQATLIRAKAHELGKHSIALCQAIQFECILRQKDCIGEWVPISEPGLSTVIDGNAKWLRGLRWEEIDKNLVLRHVTSKRQKLIEIDLNHAPMVMEEFALLGDLPASGPVIVSERLGVPWHPVAYRRAWRDIANKVGVPKEVFSMDSRAGAISEATDAGAELEHVRHAATHGDIAMTQKYSRGSTGKIAQVQIKRSEYRNKPKTGND